MKLDHKVMHPIILKGFVFMIHTIYTINLAQSGTAQVNCPDIAFFDDSVRITCSTSVNFTNIIYTCPCGPGPQCSPSFCTNLTGYNTSIVSRTQTELTIHSAQPRHAGNWSCSDGGDEGKSFCNLILTKIPTVNISSDVDVDCVNLGNRITLTVDIGGYYCSGALRLTLQVGSVNYTLGSGRNNTNMTLTDTIPINVTQTHFGDLTLVFACDNHQWKITPEGLQELQPNRSNAPTTLSPGTTATGSTPPSSDASTLLIIAVGASSGVIIVIIITVICCFCRCKKQANTDVKHPSNQPSEPPNVSVGGLSCGGYSEVIIGYHHERKCSKQQGNSQSCASKCMGVALNDPVHDSNGKEESTYDRLYMS